MDESTPAIVLASIARKNRAMLKVTLDEFHGFLNCNVRVWKPQGDSDTDFSKPTTAGVALRTATPDEINVVIDGLNKALAFLEKRKIPA